MLPLLERIGYVNDFEGIYTKDEVVYLDSILKAYHQKTTVEIVIITLSSKNIQKNMMYDYAIMLSNQWEIGNKKLNRGTTIVISKEYKLANMFVGWEIEKMITEYDTRMMVKDYMIPYFFDGRYFDGTKSLLQTYMSTLNALIER